MTFLQANIRIQMVCIAFYALLFILMTVQRKPKLKTELAFFWLLLAAFITTILDIWSERLIFSYLEAGENPGLTEFVSKFYLFGNIALNYTAFNYICRDVYNNKKLLRIEVSIAASLSLIGGILVFISPLNISDQNIAIYGSGAALSIAFGINASLLLSSIFTIIYKRKTMNKRRIFAISSWLLLWIIAATITLFMHDYNLLSFSCCLGIVIIFVILENPALRINPENGLFNMLAYNDYIYQHSEAGQYFTVSKIYLLDILENVSEEIKRTELKAFSKKLLQFKDLLIFKCNNEEYYILTDNPKVDLNKNLQEINHYFKDNITSVTPHILVLKNPYAFPSILGIEETFDIVKNNDFGFDSSSILIIDEKILEKIYERQHLIKYLKYAIENNDFDVYYQPIYNMHSKTFDSAEALCRMRTPDGEIIMPDDFIKLAEQNGLIKDLGEMVFQNVCRYISRHDMIGLGLEYIEVNLSIIQCASPTLAETLKDIMNAYGVNPARINLEITETGTLEGKKLMLENMNKLISAGVSFSLDDFGTGNSNLDYIVNLPVDIIKFDYSMVHAYFHDITAKFVMNNTINMVNGLRMKTVLEGIETKEEFDIVKELPIDHIQGFYFSEPLNENDFTKFLKERNRK